MKKTIAMLLGIILLLIMTACSSKQPAEQETDQQAHVSMTTVTQDSITLSSILFTWIASFPMLLLRKNGILVSMISVSIFTIPFLYILSILINVREIFRIGTVMSMIALVFLWTVFALCHRLKKRKLLSAGITFLLTIPFTVFINMTLSKMIGGPVMDIWDILSAFILLILAVAFLIGDHTIGKARRKMQKE